MIKIIWAILILAALGIIFGLGLSLASKYLYVKEDERIDEVAKLLPNANCGACGYPGCRGLAEAIVKGEEHKISNFVQNKKVLLKKLLLILKM